MPTNTLQLVTSDYANNGVSLTHGAFDGSKFIGTSAISPDKNYDAVIDLNFTVSNLSIVGIQVSGSWSGAGSHAFPPNYDGFLEISHNGASLGKHPDVQGAGSGSYSLSNLSIRDGTINLYGWSDGAISYTSILIEYEEGVSEAPNHEGTEPECPATHYASATPNTVAPISLVTGEKTEKVTDLSINSPAGELMFTRSYRQSKLSDAGFQQMGLGWTHSHHLTIDDSVTNKLLVQLGGGTIAHFTYDSVAGVYKGDPGSTAQIDASGSGVSKYTLSAQDGSEWIFDDQKKLQKRTWSTGEEWAYSYYEPPHIADGLLKEVSDDYGRKLQFSYIDNSGQFDHLQLWRVGDQDATGLDTSSPSGRYVEYGYVESKLNGVATGNHPLLNTVQDVRGEIWTYEWYGQAVGETDANQANWLLRVISPSVDVDANGSTDGSITIKDLTYTLSGSDITDITQKRGQFGSDPYLIETDYAFQPNGENITTETTAGKITTHRFFGEVYQGPENAAGNTHDQFLDTSYRPMLQQDANGNSTDLIWSTDGKNLEAVTDAEGNTTNFTYDSQNRLITSTDAEERKTEYSYNSTNAPRQPTEIKVIDTDGTTVLRHQKFTYDVKGRTLSEQMLDPVDGVTILQETTRVYGTSGNANGLLESITQKDLVTPSNDVSTTYTYDSVGRVVKTQKSSLFGSCQISYTVYDVAGNVLASICNYDPGVSADPTTAVEATALYDSANPDKNQVTTHVYDALGRRVQTTTNAGSLYARTSLTFYDALNRVTRTISNYSAQGTSAPGDWVWANNQWEDGASIAISHGNDDNQNIISDTEYNQRGLVRLTRDVLGNVTLYGYDDADRLVKTVQSAAIATYNNDYSGTGSDPDLRDYVENATLVDGDIISEQAYDANGNLVKSVDARGAVSYTVYDALNRPVKTILNAKPEATIDLNSGDTGYDATNDRRSNTYIASQNPDYDQISKTDYDKMGRVICTHHLLENRGSSEVWDVTLMGYDSLGRQVRTIQHASQPDYDLTNDAALDGYIISPDSEKDHVIQTVYDTQGRVQSTFDMDENESRVVYDGLNRQVKSIANYSKEGGDNAHLSSYVGDLNDPAEDIISETIYDDDGRVQKTKQVLKTNSTGTDLDWLWTLYGYDNLGRQVKVIRNANNPTYNIAGDPTLASYVASINSDEDLTSKTVYDDEGRVQKIIDNLGNVTLFGYDSTGRRVKAVQNASDDTYDVDNDPDLSAYTAAIGATIDQDRITTTKYDLVGRVVESTDSTGNISRTVYDQLGRSIRTIANYSAQATDPSLWVWTNNRWEDGNSVAINHGADFDQNLISETSYNKAGQVLQTRNSRGTVTAFSYDEAGRRIITTQAYGTGLATSNYTCFDKAGRVLRTIQNYLPLYDENDQLISPDDWDVTENWLFNPSDHGVENDQNLITAFTYDAASRRTTVTNPAGDVSSTTYFKNGQVASVTDAENTETVYRYDAARRRTTVVQNYTDASEPANWVWNGTNWEV